MRGRKPTPTVLKVLHGNPGKRPLNKREPKYSPHAPACPTWLSREAKAEWRRVVGDLDSVGMLAKVDRAALSAFCECWATMVAAQRDVAVNGMIVESVEREWKSADGVVHVMVRRAKNPAVLIARDAGAQLRLFAAEFGLTPSSRARLETPEAPAGSSGKRAGSRFLS